MIKRSCCCSEGAPLFGLTLGGELFTTLHKGTKAVDEHGKPHHDHLHCHFLPIGEGLLLSTTEQRSFTNLACNQAAGQEPSAFACDYSRIWPEKVWYVVG